MRQVRRFTLPLALAALVATAVAGCGRKGDLELPPQESGALAAPAQIG